jgi:hypothetical protein
MRLQAPCSIRVADMRPGHAQPEQLPEKPASGSKTVATEQACLSVEGHGGLLALVHERDGGLRQSRSYCTQPPLPLGIRMDDGLAMAALRRSDKHPRVFEEFACSDWVQQPGGHRKGSPQTSRSGTQKTPERNCQIGDALMIIQ